MRRLIILTLLVVLCVIFFGACSRRETEPKKMDRDPFKAREMKKP
jgi:hypothetical protein